ncbi:adhesin [Corallococcus terminator]|uniref:Adhesin n=1 Tax=Corallococcus terminator TaxID=2316733 RepID=A0A3A8JC00_9BACT|nr:adhesin [Corallococcus terminator]RKG93397.1 adhesin [Corallococcus terminator]
MMRGLQRSVFLLGLLALAATASAQTDPIPADYQYLDHWILNNSQDPFRYYVDSRVSRPGGNELTPVETAVQKAFQAWQDVNCAWPAFSYAGRSSSASIQDVRDRLDTFNVAAIWVTDRSDSAYSDVLNGDSSTSEAVIQSRNGYVYQCDIFLNAVDFQFTTAETTPAGFLDLQTIMMREIGHCLGLGDTYNSGFNAVMYALLGPGKSRRTLSTYDRGALCQRYPQTGAVGSPCTANSCGQGLTCVTTQSTTSGATLNVCSKACPDGVPGACPAPYECRASSAVPGSSFACLPAVGGAVTNVGAACTADSQCGATVSRCLTASQQTVGFPGWRDGYCSQSCSANTDCPRGSTCANVGTVGKRCLDDCRPGTSDCRPGYSCAPLPEGNACIADCATDNDCGSSFACRTCDHACIQARQGSRTVGEPCTQDTECGTNQQCLKLNGNPQGFCSEACSVDACTCSPGNTCRPAGTGGQRFCFRDCEQGTCPSPLQCTPFGQGAACIASCRFNQDCPNGLYCGSSGQCYDPFTQSDGGTCALCSDGGAPPPPPTDGGTGPSTNGPDGCGCQGAPTSAAAFLAGLGVLLLATRKRRNG